LFEGLRKEKGLSRTHPKKKRGVEKVYPWVRRRTEVGELDSLKRGALNKKNKQKGGKVEIRSN